MAFIYQKNTMDQNKLSNDAANVEKIENIVKEIMSVSGSHDFEHILRVRNTARHIGKSMNADIFVIEVAALLHDIGRIEEFKSKGAVCHAKIGFEISKKILSDFQIEEDRKNNILHCIRTHRSRGENIPKTLEAKIIYDADKLDKIGAIGIGRAFQFAGEIHAKLHNPDVDIYNTKAYTKDDTPYREFMITLKHVKEKMLTDDGRKMAESRHSFMVEFFERLSREHAGNL